MNDLELRSTGRGIMSERTVRDLAAVMEKGSSRSRQGGNNDAAMGRFSLNESSSGSLRETALSAIASGK